MNSKLLFAFFLALICATGCNREFGESQIAVDQSRSSKVYSESELNNLITPGMSIAEVTNKFGPPGSAVKVGEGMLLLTYMFPLEAKYKQGPYLTGFGIDIKNGRVVRWSPVTGMTGTTIGAEGSQSSLGERSFQIFIATDSLTNVATTVDAEGSADVSDLKALPDIMFKAKVFAGSSSGQSPDERTVIVVVSEQDASKLKRLSEENFGRRLLVVCQNKVIAAPVVTAPLASRQLIFTVKNSAVLDSLRGQ